MLESPNLAQIPTRKAVRLFWHVTKNGWLPRSSTGGIGGHNQKNHEDMQQIFSALLFLSGAASTKRF
jgi:hypothetical protein